MPKSVPQEVERLAEVDHGGIGVELKQKVAGQLLRADVQPLGVATSPREDQEVVRVPDQSSSLVLDRFVELVE